MLTAPMAEYPRFMLHAPRAIIRGASVGEFLKAKWAEILILAIMIPGFIFLYRLGWTEDTRTAVLETRMNALVNAVPESCRGVASETINQPFRSAVVVYHPIATGDDVWMAQIEILDAAKGDVTTYVAKLDRTGKENLDVGVIGSIKKADFDALNFRQMQEKEALAGLSDASSPPTTVNRDSSFIIYTDPKEIKDALKTFGFQMGEARPAIGVETWPTLKKALSDGTLGGKTPFVPMPPRN